MELRPGYKQTDIGHIPEDWDVTTVGTEFSIQLGKMIDAEKNIGVLKPYLGNRAVQWGRIVLDEIGSVRLTSSDLLRFLLQEGDLLVCEGGEVGRAAIWHQQLEECYFQKALHRLRPLRDYNISFMQKVLLHLATRGLLNNFVTQTSIAHLPKDKFLTVPLPLPPTSEQYAIAEALNDVDHLFESLEHLIAKKHQIKQGAMQELLTGGQRLPGFTGKWEVKRLGNFAPLQRGFDLPTLAIKPGPYPVVYSNGILDHHNQHLVKAPGVVTGRSGTIGKVTFIESDFWPHNTSLWVTSFNKNSPKFVFYLYGHIGLERFATGSGVPTLNRNDVHDFRAYVPTDTEEQIAIATTLSDIDIEIVELERKLEKVRRIKRGMMQELLTGRIRLVQHESNIVQFRVKRKAATTSKKGHNSAINEAVVISVLAQNFGSDQYPLGRKRYTKLSYLLHRHAEGKVEGYLEKAAGPYNPSTKYKGAEKIALSNRYVRSHARDNFSGFVAADKIAEAEGYFSKWYGDDAIVWLEQFRYKKNDELELLATVDMAMVCLREAGKQVDLVSVKRYIHEAPEWTAKLNRSIFSDDGIDMAIKWSRQLFEAEAD